MYEIRVFHTHIEVFPYEYDDVPRIENMLSKYDPVTHSYVEIGFYIKDSILYLPRGINLSLLQKLFQATPTIISNCDDYKSLRGVNMTAEPRDRIQSESIDFLTSRNDFSKGLYKSQFGLNLDTGDGKTFTMISAIIQLKMRAIIITHKSKLKEQWKEEFLSKTDIEEERILNITGASTIEKIMDDELDADIFIVNHQTLQSYAKSTNSDTEECNGWSKVRAFFQKIQVGIKVIDEAHKFFENTLMIDYFSNVKRSYYLTATFSRGDQREQRIFKMAFSSMYRFGEETLNYEEKRKHIHLVVVYFRTFPDIDEIKSLSTGYGFSSYKYIDYEIENKTMMKVILKILKDVESLEGKILINSPKVDSSEYIAEEIRKSGTQKSVGTVHSKNPKDINEESYNKDIICSTIKSIGEGDNIKKLRILINTEPIASKGLVDQLRGRLREYDEEKDTYLFYLVDTSVESCTVFLEKIMPVMKKKCKDIRFMRMNL